MITYGIMNFDPHFVDWTTVSVEKTVRDGVTRKREEFGFDRNSDTVLELIRYHDILPEYVDNRTKLKVLFKALQDDEVDAILTDFVNSNWQHKNLDLVASISEIRDNEG